MSSNKERPQAQRNWAQGLSASRRAYNTGMRALIYIAAAIVVALLIFLLGYPVPGTAQPHPAVPDLGGERGP